METELKINIPAARKALRIKTRFINDKMVHLVMASFSDEQGDCGLSPAEIAAHSILPARAVEPCLQRLEKAGLISQTMPATDGLPVIWRVGVATP